MEARADEALIDAPAEAAADPLPGLLAACARRDREAFARLYKATSPKLYGVAVRILRREDWAEEVLQDCYVSIWTHAPDYRAGLAAPMTWMTSIVRNRCLDWLRRPRVEIADEDDAIAAAKSAPLTWMTSIVRNRCLDWLRRPRTEATGEEYDVAVEAWRDESPGPLEQLAASSEAAALARCLEQLEPRQRQSIMLAFFNGLSHTELAGHMKQPLGTVKTWVRRGLERLKSCLGAAA